MVQLQALKGLFWYFQDQFSGMTKQFACRIKKLAPEGISIHRYRNHWLADIFFEGFEEVIAKQHQIVPCGIGNEVLEGKLLMTKVFQRPVGQFILSPSVVRAKDAMSIDALFFSGLAELAINGLSHTKVRNDHAIMIQTRQRELAIVFNQAAVDRATSLLPCPLLALKLGVLPDLLLAR